MANPKSENKDANEQRALFGPRVHVSHRFVDSHRETGGFGSPSHETDSVALEESLARARGPREGDSSSQISISSSAVVAGRKQCAQRPTSSSSTACSAVVYRRLKRRLGAHLGDHTAKGVWSDSESQFHINFLELKAVLLALKKFEQQCWGQIILIATDNTTVVSYINKEGGMRSGSLCALLWRLLSWCHRRQIVLRARHIPGRLNVIADKLSRSTQVIQTEWSLLQEVFDHLCARWHTPRVDLFATRYNHKLPKFVSPVPDPQAWRVDALSLNWENMDAYAFPPVSLLGKVVSKILDQGVHRLVLIAPGWPNMPWFWDLVSMSVQIPLSLPNVENLLTQPFNQCPHRDLLGLNLHTWLLEPLAYRHKDSLMKWQQELRLLRDNQPEPSMN